jgi:hypothetical protein
VNEIMVMQPDNGILLSTKKKSTVKLHRRSFNVYLYVNEANFERAAFCVILRCHTLEITKEINSCQGWGWG